MFEDIHQLRERARVALARNQLDEAVHALSLAATQTHVPESDYMSVVRPLAEVFFRQGNVRAAYSVLWYIAKNDSSQLRQAASAMEQVPAVDRARTLVALGDLPSAAAHLESAGLLAQAAVLREKSNDWQNARTLWSRLTQVAPNRADAYVRALIYFNLARASKRCKDATRAQEAMVTSIHSLEEAADYFEANGQRERAFDCFQVLVQVGRESGSFEDVLEGYVNCIRILREDQLKYFALQYFDEALAAARERQEYSAAATLAREAADYARSIAMVPLSMHYVLEQGALWRTVAELHLKRGAPAAIAENALLAAVLAYGDVGQFGTIGELYQELAQMDLDVARKAHYARATQRYRSLGNERLQSNALPSHLKQDSSFPDVWHVDVIEWEQAGSAAEACADILQDARWPDLIRRKALVARLNALAVEGEPGRAPQGAWVLGAKVQLCEQLSQLQLFAVLSPLENLFTSREREVRVAVLKALETLFFKRTFDTVRKGLKDSDPIVVKAASTAVEALYFQHAFDPLARIIRESSHAEVRASAIRAVSKIDTVEASEFMLSMLEHGAPQDRVCAQDALQKARGTRFVEVAKAAMGVVTSDVQKLLTDVLRARGVQVS